MTDIPTYHRGDRNFGTGYDMMKQIEALEDEIERLRAAPIVKPLAWLWGGVPKDNQAAHSIIGEFRVSKTANKSNDRYMVTYIDPRRKSHTIGYIDGLEEAKAVAQAIYERRIRAALTQEGKG